MKRIFAICLMSCLTAGLAAQDNSSTESEEKEKLLNHEIGFNLVRIFSQFTVYTPTLVSQLPFDFFYNLYYKDKVGLRFGAGFSSSDFEGEPVNNVMVDNSSTVNRDMRFGVSYNFSKVRRVTFNVFADYLTQRYRTESVRTTSVQTFPNPILITTTEQYNTTTGRGIYCGVGLKFNLHKSLALYTELPFVYVWGNTTSEDIVKESALDDVLVRNASKAFTRANLLPTTIYLVLRF